MNIVIIVVGIILCIIGSFFFSSSEMAYNSCNQIRMEKAAEEGSKKAKNVLHITSHFDDALSAILIGNNLVNIASSSLTSVLLILLTGTDSYAWIATLVLTLVIIIFGETMPKIIAKRNANKMALNFSGIICFLMIIFKPLIVLVVLLVRLFTFFLKKEEDNSDEAVEELQSIIETAEDEQVLDGSQSELVQAAIDFSTLSAMDVMTARVDVEAIDIDDSIEDIASKIESSSYSRLPVYEESIDDVIGVLTLNHFLKARCDNTDIDLRSLLMKPCHIYKTTKLPEVLNLLKKEKQHLAIVTDEYGGTLGVLSLEDVLEEIVGEIWDETDEIEEEVVELKEGEYELDGDMSLDDFAQLLNIKEDELDAESETVGGWTLECLEHFPTVGESFEFKNLKVIVVEMDNRRVEKVLVKKIDNSLV